jgi:hypothetical protein
MKIRNRWNDSWGRFPGILRGNESVEGSDGSVKGTVNGGTEE